MTSLTLPWNDWQTSCYHLGLEYSASRVHQCPDCLWEQVWWQIYWQSRVTRTGFHSLEAPAQKGGVVNSTSIPQQPPQHTIPTSPIAQLPQGIDPNDPTIKGLYSDKKIKKSLLDRIVSSVSDGVSVFVGTPQRNDNLNFDNSETSSVASDSSNIVDFQATSKTNKDLKYTQQDLEKIKTDMENQYKIQVAIERKNFEKESQNHLKTIENGHKEKLSTIETKIARQIENEIKDIQASANEQNTKHLETIEMLQQRVKTLTKEINQTPSTNLATPPPFPLANQSMFYNQSMLNDSLVQMIDKFEKSILIQNSAIVQSLQQNRASSKEHYISSAKTYDGKDPKEFNGWLDSVTRLSRISDKELIEVAVATSTGQLHKYISELMGLGLNWDAIKGMIQERFSEFGSSIVARNKLSSFTQKTMAMHEYISEFTTILEHAHDIRPSDSKSTILASTFIDGIQNLYIRNKLRSYNVQNLSELYGLAIKEDQKQKIRELDFGNSTPQETIAHCDVNAIKGNGCYKHGSNAITSKTAPSVGILAILTIALAIAKRNNTMPIVKIKEKLDMKALLNNHSKQ